jgi:uncharacterized SAM-binding protein YcdF (DUF218 family)
LKLSASFLTVCIVILLGVVALRWQSALTSLGNFLIDSQPPQKADLIVVLGGDFLGPRVLIGAELARQRYAPVALLSGPPYQGRPEGAVAVDFLVSRGYQRDIFQVFPTGANSTIAEAEALRIELSRRRVKRVLLVTSNYHSRRAEIVLTLFCPGVRFISIPAPDSHYHAEDWWQDESSRRLFFMEWGKIVGTVLVAYPASIVSRVLSR